MLSKVRGKRRIRRFAVYDMEWIPRRYEIRCISVYDGKRYRTYYTCESFLNAELSSANRGIWFYAHAGGLADVQFVLETMIAHGGYKVEASFSGSSAIIVKVKRGKNVWTFVDSYWLLKAPLANIGKALGIEKGEAESRLTEKDAEEFYATCPIERLVEYNRLDCLILYTAIDEIETAFMALGGQLQKTLAACSMYLFRRRFLKSDIDTCAAVNAKARKAYFASRVEVFNRFAGDCYYYDINSSFPAAMLAPAPGESIEICRDFPPYGLYMADVEIWSPDTYLPTIPTRIEGRLFFPTGKWRSWLMSTDIELLEREGGRIMKVHEVVVFEPFHDLAEYSQTLYNARLRSTSEWERMVYKLLLNSLYGKFAEGALKSRLVIDPKEITPSMEMLFPGAWIEEREVPVPHMHVPISSHITALARKRLYDFLSLCGEFHYCDTDGFSTKEVLTTSTELGKLKLEKLVRDGFFIAPKLYRLQGTDEKGKELGDKGIKAKGFSRMTAERWEKLVSGDEIETYRMARVKEVMRSGNTRPRDKRVPKKVKNILPKRFTYPDGSTRPWHVSELESILG